MDHEIHTDPRALPYEVALTDTRALPCEVALTDTRALPYEVAGAVGALNGLSLLPCCAQGCKPLTPPFRSSACLPFFLCCLLAGH
jgi:hypothetical protein